MAPFSECCANVSHPFYNFSIGNIFASASSVSRTMVRCFVSDWNFLTLTSSSPMHTALFPGELEHVAEPRQTRPEILFQKILPGTTLGWGGDGEVLAPGVHAADSEVRLPEVNLDLAGQPAQGQVASVFPAVALLGHLLAPPLHVSLRGGSSSRRSQVRNGAWRTHLMAVSGGRL